MLKREVQEALYHDLKNKLDLLKGIEKNQTDSS